MSEDRSGYVYIVQMEGSNCYKIGRTKNVPRRMSEFGLQLPFKYRLIACAAAVDAPRCESLLHQAHASQRINGEWFSLTEEDVQDLRELMLYCQAIALVDRLDDVGPQGAITDEYWDNFERILRVQIKAVRRARRRKPEWIVKSRYA